MDSWVSQVDRRLSFRVRASCSSSTYPIHHVNAWQHGSMAAWQHGSMDEACMYACMHACMHPWMHAYTHVFIIHSVYASVGPSVHRSVCLSIRPSVRPSVRPPVYLSTNSSTHLSTLPTNQPSLQLCIYSLSSLTRYILMVLGHSAVEPSAEMARQPTSRLHRCMPFEILVTCVHRLRGSSSGFNSAGSRLQPARPRCKSMSMPMPCLCLPHGRS